MLSLIVTVIFITLVFIVSGISAANNKEYALELKIRDKLRGMSKEEKETFLKKN